MTATRRGLSGIASRRRGHRHGHLDDIAGIPGAVDRHVVRWSRITCERFSVDGQFDTAHRPIGVADLQGQASRLLAGEAKRGRVIVGVFGFLAKDDALLFPGELRGNGEIHVKGVVTVKINGVAVFRMVFHAGPDTAGEALGVLIVFAAAHFECQVVDDSSVLRVLAGKDVVVESPFVEVSNFGVGRPLEEMTGKLEHVVDIAGFGRVGPESIVELVGFAEVLVEAVAPRDIGVVIDDTIPEELGCLAVVVVACQFVASRQADEFWNLCVGVDSRQAVDAFGKRAKDGLVVEFLRQIEVPLFVRVGVEIGEDLVDAPRVRNGASSGFVHD